MRVLVVGGGGREHALVWKIRQSPYVEEIYCAPGNGGIGEIAECVDIEDTDLKGLVQFAKKNSIDLTVVGPELPLTMGIADRFKDKGLIIFGPDKKAAELEGSKAFAKEIMHKYLIPTAEFQVFTKRSQAIQYVNDTEPPYVLKADGLAAGKGVLICRSRKEAFDGIDVIMKQKKFGNAGKQLVIEEYLEGEEASVLAITDGENLVFLPAAQDHKAIFEGDQGPNTGGMGAYAPAPLIDSKMMKNIEKKILRPTIEAMKAVGRPYSGVLYAGLMITSEGPKLLEYNCRFGDPEIQAILPLLKTDIVDLMIETTEERLKEGDLEFYDKAAICVVMASGGYPGEYKKGMEIHGLKKVSSDILVFHAGTKYKDGKMYTSGGRVLGVTSVNDTLELAMKNVYEAVGKITFNGAYYRKDIGHKAMHH